MLISHNFYLSSVENPNEKSVHGTPDVSGRLEMINMQCMLHSVTTRPVFLARTLIDFQAVLYKLYNIVQIQMTIISSKIQMNVRHYYLPGAGGAGGPA